MFMQRLDLPPHTTRIPAASFFLLVSYRAIAVIAITAFALWSWTCTLSPCFLLTPAILPWLCAQQSFQEPWAMLRKLRGINHAGCVAGHSALPFMWRAVQVCVCVSECACQWASKHRAAQVALIEAYGCRCAFSVHNLPSRNRAPLILNYSGGSAEECWQRLVLFLCLGCFRHVQLLAGADVLQPWRTCRHLHQHFVLAGWAGLGLRISIPWSRMLQPKADWIIDCLDCSSIIYAFKVHVFCILPQSRTHYAAPFLLIELSFFPAHWLHAHPNKAEGAPWTQEVDLELILGKSSILDLPPPITTMLQGYQAWQLLAVQQQTQCRAESYRWVLRSPHACEYHGQVAWSPQSGWSTLVQGIGGVDPICAEACNHMHTHASQWAAQLMHC